MNELNKAELRTLAEAAMPGDWFKAGNLLCFDVKSGESHGLNVEDDRFIASASPAAVLSLLDECDKAEAERDAALAEREELRRLLDCFVKGESDPDENQSERHMYVTEAQSLLAHIGGEIKAHTLVSDEVLHEQAQELEACKSQLRALIHISDATGWECHTCGEIAKARSLVGVFVADLVWQSTETAPKDRMILVDVGMPWAAVATWSDYAEKWMLAELEWNVCDGKADPGFVTEYERTIKGWMELPEVAHG